MKKQTISMTKLPFFMVALSLIACAKQPVKTQQAMDLNNPGDIELHLQANDTSIPLKTISQTVINNLKLWAYPVVINPTANVSHLLTATVGTVARGSSPAGFSYSAGNSDPRSLDFQKMDILPITCQIQSTLHPDQANELSMDFMADKSDKSYLASDKLADHISTVCFNLLTEIKWPVKEKKEGQSSAIKSPSWMPEIRIEDKMTTDDPITTSVSQPAVTPNTASEQDVKSPESEKNTNPEEPKVRIQRDEPRRQIIIHNQGSPMILEFGYERR